MGTFRRIHLIAFLALGLLLNGSCANKKQASTVEYQKDCSLDANQVGSLDGRWKSLPIPIAVRQGHFSDSEIAEIQTAVKTWNSYFMKSQGIFAFDFGTADAPSVSTEDRPIASCNESIVSATAGNTERFIGPVVVYKFGVWPHTTAPDAIAITQTCKKVTNNLAIKPYFWSAIDVNYQNFFVDGKPQADLQTNILHELGHVLGMLHSCSADAGTTDFLSCTDSSITAAYKDAIMYPYDQSSDGILKRKLRLNDQARTSCLYGDTAYSWNDSATKVPASTPTPASTASTSTYYLPENSRAADRSPASESDDAR